MSYKLVATASALVSLIYGLATLVFTDAFATLYGVAFDSAALFVGRMLAGSYLGYAILNFLTRTTGDSATRRAVATANTCAWAFGVVVCTAAQIQGLTNALGWTTVLLTVVFTVGWASTLLSPRERQPETRRATVRS